MNMNFTPPPERKFPEARLQQQKEQLLFRIQAERPQQPQRHRRWAFAIGGATAAAALAIALVALLPAGRGGPSNAAAATLNRLANRVATQPLTPLPGQYLYLDFKSEWGTFGGNCETRSVEHRQIWIGVDGSGLDRSATEPGHFTSAADRATCLSMASNSDAAKASLQNTLAARTSDDWNAPQCLELGPTSDWSSLSSEPHALLQQILNLYHGEKATPAQEFSYIAELLGQTDAPPAVRANIYRAAALIPSVQSLGTVQDHDGRPGLGLAITTGEGTPNASDELIFDPQTGQLLGETATGPYGGWDVYLDTKVVNGLPSQPPAPLTPPCTSRGEGTVQHIPGGSITTGKGLPSP